MLFPGLFLCAAVLVGLFLHAHFLYSCGLQLDRARLSTPAIFPCWKGLQPGLFLHSQRQRWSGSSWRTLEGFLLDHNRRRGVSPK